MVIESLTAAQKNAFEKKGVTNDYQLRRWFPIRYIDNSKESGVSQILVDKHVVVIGRLMQVEERQSQAGRWFLKCRVIDRLSNAPVSVTVFTTSKAVNWLFSKFRAWTGSEVIAAGKLQFHPVYGYSITEPDIFSWDVKNNMKIIPVFSSVRGIAKDKVQGFVNDALTDNEEETIRPDIMIKYHITGVNHALHELNRPSSYDSIRPARCRILFDDMWYMAARFEITGRNVKDDGLKIRKTDIAEKIINSLPYSLTNGQREVYESIRNKMLSGKHIHALVQGDVGCGKTITAFLSMILAAENGYQATMMAPTKILAEQHYKKLMELLKDTDINVLLISGKVPTKRDLKKLSKGEYQIVIGTSGILSDKVVFKNLSLLVIDEEHKFGVEQREKLTFKAREIDTISMSATPIPRTLAGAVYGEGIDVFSIKDMPYGRKPVKTAYSNGNGLKVILDTILGRGQQAYVVCPMIDEDEEDDPSKHIISTKEAVEKYQKLCPGRIVREINGTMNKKDTEDTIQDFYKGKIDILVSTTIVEVGVDVPNANLIIIENAERFGLAGMHQLRGRVGRGQEQGYCVLLSKDTPEENERLKTLISTTDGFKIAEKDMIFLRKSGNLFGNEQSGNNKYIEEIVRYKDLYDHLREEVKNIPDDELWRHIRKIENSEVRVKMKPVILE